MLDFFTEKFDEEIQKLLLEGSGDGHWAWNVATGQLYHTKQFCHMLGYESVPNHTELFAALSHPEDVIRGREILNEYFAGKHEKFEFDYRIKNAEGNYVWVQTRGRVVQRDSQGKPLLMVGATTDISRQVRLTQSAKLASLGEVASGVAHEINNPLTIINSYTDVLKEHLANHGKSDEVSLAYIDKILKSVGRIAQIVKNLRSLSRDGSRDPMEILEVSAIIDQVETLARERGKNKNIQMSYKRKSELFIKARAVQIGQVLIHLINNAMDAVENQARGAWIKLEVESSEDKVYIRVTDSGAGISPENRKKIMQPFFTTKPVNQGTGLGLSVSKAIMEEHQGHLYLDESSAHTAFVIEIPQFKFHSKNLDISL